MRRTRGEIGLFFLLALVVFAAPARLGDMVVFLPAVFAAPLD